MTLDTLVELKQGKVQGFLDEATNTWAWKGVPYAEKAVGELRFKAPVPVKKHEGILDCTQEATWNIQCTPRKTIIGEEGILTLDIYRPATNEENLPVLVYIHGGNNQTHGSSTWKGHKFCQRTNTMLVSISYRLGPFGFNNLPALQKDADPLEASGNFALLDTLQALKWMKENLQAFGGNPDNLTVSGISSGGRDSLAMLTSPLFKGMFEKIISFSGGLTMTEPEKGQKRLAAAYAHLVVEDGIKANIDEAKAWLLSDVPEVKEYLLKIDAKRLVPLMSAAQIRMSVYPHLYKDGVVLPKEGFDCAEINSVPVLLITAEGEFSLFCSRDKYFHDNLAKFEEKGEFYREFLFAKKYGSLMYQDFNGQGAAAKLYPNYKSDIFVNVCRFGHDTNSVSEYYAERNDAFHGIIMEFVTGEKMSAFPPEIIVPVPGTFATEGALDLVDKYMQSLADFMRTGKPSMPGSEEEWPAWTPENRAESVFDADKEKAILSVRSDAFSFEKLFAAIDADTSISEESKQKIIKEVFNGRWFSDPFDEHYGNEDSWLSRL